MDKDDNKLLFRFEYISKSELKQIAKEERRSLNQIINIALEDYVKDYKLSKKTTSK